MTDLEASIAAGALAGTAASLVMFRLLPVALTALAAARQKSAAPPPAAQPAPDLTAEQGIDTVLPPLRKAITPLAEDIDHPRELLTMPEFDALVAAFRRPDATFALLSQNALGGNWAVACAAYLVLADHPERQSLCDPVLRAIPQTRPFALMFALRFLASLDHRPPAGAALLGTPPWWQHNQVIPGLFQDFFERLANAGEAATFGDGLVRRPDFDPAPVDGLLRKIQHPFAAKLLAELHGWNSTRIDRAFLGTVGTLADPAGDDPLLVEPPDWKSLIAAAEAVISQARPRSVLVTGEPRTGKSALIRLIGRDLGLLGWTIFSASGAELMADQMYIGQLEGRVKNLVEALHARRKLVWQVGDIAAIADSGRHQGQTASILDQILPAIVAGDLIVMGEMSPAAATRLFQARPSLRSLFEVLTLQPMDEGETLDLATTLAAQIGKATRIAVPEPAVAAALQLANHYLGAGQSPGGALELLKQSVARAISAGEDTLTEASVIATLSQLSGLPRLILDSGQRADLAGIRDFFTRRVIGQQEAVDAVVDRIAMLKAGLTDPGKPTGVLLFAGPTGTGKTELAKCLAEFLFGSADRMARLDMSEFQTPESVGKIVGQRGDPGADSLIDRIRKQPFSVVLLDEFEKAHANTWDLFLQIFDDGRLSDANGREADFRHCFIILTSNLGAAIGRATNLGFGAGAAADLEEQVLQTVSQTFRPEFVNRLDKIIVFRPLSRALMRTLLHKELAHVLERRGLRERAWAVEWESSALDLLLDRGFSSTMGARPLKRAIDQLLLAPLAATLVEHRFPEGDQFLFVRANGPRLEVEFVDPDGDAGEVAVTEPGGDVSLPSIVLRQTGSAAERATLMATWKDIARTLGGAAWAAGLEALNLAMADPGFWASPDRFATLSALEMADRVKEAARTAERLFDRYVASSQDAERASRELASRLALQLLNVRRGLDDIVERAPADALLRVEPAVEAGADLTAALFWSATLAGMYRQWGARRRMQVTEIKSGAGGASPILHVTGFGAFRTLQFEAGLHVLDEPVAETTRRVVARVVVVSGPEQDLPQAGRHAAATRLLDAAPPGTAIVRRYREHPAPMVRDAAQGWRTGRLDAVLGGDFDVMGADGATGSR